MNQEKQERLITSTVASIGMVAALTTPMLEDKISSNHMHKLDNPQSEYVQIVKMPEPDPLKGVAEFSENIVNVAELYLEVKKDKKRTDENLKRAEPSLATYSSSPLPQTREERDIWEAREKGWELERRLNTNRELDMDHELDIDISL